MAKSYINQIYLKCICYKCILAFIVYVIDVYFNQTKHEGYLVTKYAKIGENILIWCLISLL